MPTTVTLFTQGAVAIEREERRRCIPRGEGLSSDRSTFIRSPVKTFGRFSVRGPAAWRKDGGTGKNSNTMCGACKDLPCELWLVRYHHKERPESRREGAVLSGRVHCPDGGPRQGCFEFFHQLRPNEETHPAGEYRVHGFHAGRTGKRCKRAQRQTPGGHQDPHSEGIGPASCRKGFPQKSESFLTHRRRQSDSALSQQSRIKAASSACRTRRGCGSGGPRGAFLRGSRAAREGT